jgi:hypothetical protein
MQLKAFFSGLNVDFRSISFSDTPENNLRVLSLALRVGGAVGSVWYGLQALWMMITAPTFTLLIPALLGFVIYHDALVIGCNTFKILDFNTRTATSSESGLKSTWGAMKRFFTEKVTGVPEPFENTWLIGPVVKHFTKI